MEGNTLRLLGVVILSTHNCVAHSAACKEYLEVLEVSKSNRCTGPFPTQVHRADRSTGRWSEREEETKGGQGGKGPGKALAVNACVTCVSQSAQQPSPGAGWENHTVQEQETVQSKDFLSRALRRRWESELGGSAHTELAVQMRLLALLDLDGEEFPYEGAALCEVLCAGEAVKGL
ncbi:hypothetical protein CYMTET_37168 [Cymbomonas tetramitiformis]|uniref:Uncharacterized protein n=1 Tax=Cymbomonas tetramitiformis TaxID=36881 RepID=A0AAE0CEK6_9CHLO|nr:hypothetical protein CYMTET_37168 [Cymbomonas tetramitiformis]